jgi:hypothetical protein
MTRVTRDSRVYTREKNFHHSTNKKTLSRLQMSRVTRVTCVHKHYTRVHTRVHVYLPVSTKKRKFALVRIEK